MLRCRARCLHLGATALWGAQAPAQKPVSPSPPLNLDDRKVFQHKANWEITRGLLVFLLCSSPQLVQKAPRLLSVSRRVLGRRLWGSLLRLTLYGQFVAGETPEEIKATLQRLQQLKVRPLLAVPIEEDVGQAKEGEGWYDTNAQAMLACLDLSVRGLSGESPRNPMMQLKITALMGAELCVKLTSVKTITLRLQEQEGPLDLTVERVLALLKGEELSFGCLSPEENLHFQKSLSRLRSVAEYAVEKKVRVLVDAEYTYINPALSLVTMAMMAACNTQVPWIWNTYQAYLKDTLKRLSHDMALAERLGVCFGVKLVRGAYLEKERQRAREKGYRDPVHATWEATNESYRRCLDFALDRASHAGGRFELIVATHNKASVEHAVRRIEEMDINKNDGPVSFGQLLGMCDHISLPLGHAGYAVYKSIPYGSVEEVIPYLIRRAHENRSVLQGIREERDLLRSELWRRILRKP
ncbi:PREDICTED: probable proline dehydrogenase 2 [Gekko japonicus]|uniref:Proline dehydrogenase n=1 Tax=Gekko japonicus TaxID=146911 RepID=A0ABM1KJ45_GEKJA|nr:PREDICTED: probable proline dehydrogenase 2 [Gekko japonicus]